MKGVSKVQRFIEEYPVDMNATQAAIRAGYSPRTARAQGSKLLTRLDVKQAISDYILERREKIALKVKVDEEYVLATIIKTIESASEREPIFDKDGVQVGERKPDHANMLKGAELLGRHLAMFTDKQQVEQVDRDGMIERLNAARDRLARKARDSKQEMH